VKALDAEMLAKRQGQTLVTVTRTIEKEVTEEEAEVLYRHGWTRKKET